MVVGHAGYSFTKHSGVPISSNLWSKTAPGWRTGNWEQAHSIAATQHMLLETMSPLTCAFTSQKTANARVHDLCGVRSRFLHPQSTARNPGKAAKPTVPVS